MRILGPIDTKNHLVAVLESGLLSLWISGGAKEKVVPVFSTPGKLLEFATAAGARRVQVKYVDDPKGLVAYLDKRGWGVIVDPSPSILNIPEGESQEVHYVILTPTGEQT